MAEENRLRCPCPRLVRFERAQAERYDPKGASAFFFFNPFSEAVLRAALLRILAKRPVRPERMRLFFYYPSEAYELCLAQESRLRRAGEIDCRDLFGGKNPREKILICETDG